MTGDLIKTEKLGHRDTHRGRISREEEGRYIKACRRQRLPEGGIEAGNRFYPTTFRKNPPC